MCLAFPCLKRCSLVKKFMECMSTKSYKHQVLIHKKITLRSNLRKVKKNFGARRLRSSKHQPAIEHNYADRPKNICPSISSGHFPPLVENGAAGSRTRMLAENPVVRGVFTWPFAVLGYYTRQPSNPPSRYHFGPS